MEQERYVEAQDNASALPQFPRKKERRAKRKQITDNIRKYTAKDYVAPENEEDPGIKRPRYFFLRNKLGQPVVCVCEVAYFGQTYRGVSICSPLEIEDQKFRKVTGRKIAFDRAIAAIMYNGNCMPVLRDEPKAVLSSVGVDLSGAATTKLVLYKIQAGAAPTDEILTAAHKAREQKKV